MAELKLRTTSGDVEMQSIPSQGEAQIKDGVAKRIWAKMSQTQSEEPDLSAIGAAIVMIKTQVGLGVLAIPLAFHMLGLVPGLLSLALMAAMTTWAGHMVGEFMNRHLEVRNIADVGAVIFGPCGQWVLTVFLFLFWVFVAAAGMLGNSIALNAVTQHGTCTIYFMIIAAVIPTMISCVRSLGKIAWIAYVGFACIMAAIVLITIVVGIQERPASAPADIPWHSDWRLFHEPSFQEAATALSMLAFSLSGTPGFFNIRDKMKSKKNYTKSLLWAQSFVASVYAVIGTVVYIYCGSKVSSPALGSAGPMFKRIAYGLAIPGLLVTTVLSIWITSDLIHVRMSREWKWLADNERSRKNIWYVVVITISGLAYLVGSTIPYFDGLVAIIGAFLGSPMCFSLMGVMWFYDNYGRVYLRHGFRHRSMIFWSYFVFLAGAFLMAAGTYGSVAHVVALVNDPESERSKPFSCADNSRG